MHTPDHLSNGPKFALTYFACGGNLREVTHHMKLDTFVKIFCAAIVLLGCCVLISNAAHADERTKNPFVQCIAQQATNNESACLDKLGRIEWHPIKSPDSCISVGQNLKLADQNKYPFLGRRFLRTNVAAGLASRFIREHTSRIQTPQAPMNGRPIPMCNALNNKSSTM